METPAIVGLAFSSGDALSKGFKVLPCFLVGTFLLMAHVFSFNDWAGRHSDRQDPCKSQSTFQAKGMRPGEMLLLSGILGMLSLAVLGILFCRLLGITVLLLAFSLLYSFPSHRWQGKATPFFSSALHILGGLLTFLLGYGFHAGFDRRGIAIGLYFGILFAAGHLTQEVQDHSGDAANKISTHAVRCGKQPVFVAAFVLFSFSFMYLVWLAWAGFIPLFLSYLFVLYPVYAVMAWRAYSNGLGYEHVRCLRRQYRLLYAGIILILGMSPLVIL
jgi:4-hydroxybenzoate polyprenyltransferase